MVHKTQSYLKRNSINGEVYYAVFNNFDYWLRFNLVYGYEERMAKLLLQMPLIRQEYHHRVKLVSHRFKRQSLMTKSEDFDKETGIDASDYNSPQQLR